MITSILKLTQKKGLTLFLPLTLLALIISISPALAQNASSLDATTCNALNIVRGNAGKIFAAFAIISVGIGFFTGKVSWGLLVGVSIGIATIFGAPSIVGVISGQDIGECERGVVYVTSCQGSSCFACPQGFTGENCDQCANGFEGANCDTCKTGYVGSDCSQCDSLNGYSPFDGQCFLGCTVNVKGVNSPDSVLPGASSLSCNQAGFGGLVNYICQNETLTATNVCSCLGNRTGENCDTCLSGYNLSTNCQTCLNGYSLVNDQCQQDCIISTLNLTGIDDLRPVVPGTGILGCTKTGYNGTLNYNCQNGNFSTADSCTCDTENGYVLKDGVCSCDTENGYAIVDGICILDTSCPIPAIKGIIATGSKEQGNGTLICDAENFDGKTINYTCANNTLTPSGTCKCLTGYTGANCTTCDTANNYSDFDNNQTCELKCEITGQTGIVDGTFVDSGSTSRACNSPNATGNITYTCSNAILSNIINNCVAPICSGGTESDVTIGGISYRLHTFTTTGTSALNCYQSATAQVLVVAGGGAGGSHPVGGGGGGAGGVIENSSYSLSSGSHSITVGAGGTNNNGGNSSLDSLIAIGGGLGGGSVAGLNGNSGGSGGGGFGGIQSPQAGASGTSGQGFSGGSHSQGGLGGGGASGAGGGGGAGGAGGNASGNGSPVFVGAGGVGRQSFITGSNSYYVGGGGVGGTSSHQGSCNTTVATTGGGLGGGGNIGQNGANGLGGGGGGSCSNAQSSRGGSGVVIVRYQKNP